MLFKKILLASLVCVIPQLSIAAPSINDMQTCQGLLDFLQIKLKKSPAKYSPADVAKVRKGLKGYNQYIQSQIVTPGLVKFNKGDKAKASAMQKQVDAYKLTLVKGYQQRYPQNRLFLDHAIAVNNCAKIAVPSGQALNELKVALNTIVALAKLN